MYSAFIQFYHFRRREYNNCHICTGNDEWRGILRRKLKVMQQYDTTWKKMGSLLGQKLSQLQWPPKRGHPLLKAEKGKEGEGGCGPPEAKRGGHPPPPPPPPPTRDMGPGEGTIGR